MTNPEPLDQDLLMAEIRERLPEPIREETQLDGSLVMVGGDPGEVVVQVVGNKVSVSLFSVRWEGPHTPVVCPRRLASFNWKRLPASRLMMVLYEAIESAVELRRSRYRKCKRCGEAKPPEWMHDEKTCQSCAERHLGVVH